MRRLIIHTILAVCAFCSIIGKAQSNRDGVMTNIEHALLQPDQSWQCLTVNTPQGEPGPESPKGKKYQYSCQQTDLAVQVFIFYGETSADAEKILANSQRLEVNVSKEVEGFGEKGYELVQESYAWITFRKGNVYCKVNVGRRNPSSAGGPFADKSDSREAVKDEARRFARLVVNQIPAT